LFPRLIYGDGHAYSNPFSGIGTEATVSSMTTDELRAFYRRWLRPDNATLLIVGDTTLAQIQPLLEQRLAAGSPGRERARKAARCHRASTQAADLSDQPHRLLNSRWSCGRAGTATSGP